MEVVEAGRSAASRVAEAAAAAAAAAPPTFSAAEQQALAAEASGITRRTLADIWGSPGQSANSQPDESQEQTGSRHSPDDDARRSPEDREHADDRHSSDGQEPAYGWRAAEEEIASRSQQRDPVVVADEERLTVAMAHLDAGRFAEAIPLLEVVLAKPPVGTTPSDLLQYRLKLAVAQRDAGNVQAALEHLEAMQAWLEQSDSTYKMQALQTQIEIGITLAADRQTHDAIWMFEGVIPDVVSTYGAEDRETLTVRVLLARAYRDAGDTELAIGVYQDALAVAERTLGLRDEITSCAYGELTALRRSRIS